ncbi:MAG: UvrD-helicase domain-containing protein [Clostridiales bacterium]|nr:UvrD-helicase domain-containing protein [Clostridiales bacterium]
MSLQTEFSAVKRALLEKEFARMNDRQREAVFRVEGPLLILAGAGSGKTTVLVNRIANIIKYGNAYHSDTVPEEVSGMDVQAMQAALESGAPLTEDLVEMMASFPARPWQILAITFTNKAAGELKERLETMLGEEGRDVWAFTFHSFCARILRQYADRIGYTKNFTIYDTDDSRRLMKDCLKRLRVDEKMLSHKSVLSEISRCKDSMVSAQQMMDSAVSDVRRKQIAEAYQMYQQRLKEADAMDFDDLLYNAVRLLEQEEEVLEYFRNRFRYILVDEYQDTNHSQYRLVSLLAGKSRNLCVVGDDDQSIYRFRGATIENILSFEAQYPEAKVIRLEQNYRSTKNILGAANAVITNNSERKGKNLWTQNVQGEPIVLYNAENEQEEARYLCEMILENVRKGRKFSDHAILYRLNAQASSIERALVKSGVPYRILAGMRFFEHKEIKDLLAYLCVINNPADIVRMRRIINEPKRQIGDATVATAAEIASGLGLTFYEVIRTADQYDALKRAAVRLKAFTDMMDSLMDAAERVSLHELYEMVLHETGYYEMLKNMGDEGISRIENVNELASTILTYEEENEEPSLYGFLEEISLMSDIDNYDSSADAVTLMTIHSAKGLEFPVVMIPGMEEGVFPGIQSIYNPADLEEERRLAYVGITRAREELVLTECESRMLYGSTSRNRQSRFVGEIPAEYLNVTRERTVRQPAQAKQPPQPSERQIARAVSVHAAHILGTGRSSGEQKSDSYQTGERVLHKTFGAGTIQSVRQMGGDQLIEIAFDTAGTKKVMANYANLKKQ